MPGAVGRPGSVGACLGCERPPPAVCTGIETRDCSSALNRSRYPSPPPPPMLTTASFHRLCGREQTVQRRHSPPGRWHQRAIHLPHEERAAGPRNKLGSSRAANDPTLLCPTPLATDGIRRTDEVEKWSPPVSVVASSALPGGRAAATASPLPAWPSPQPPPSPRPPLPRHHCGLPVSTRTGNAYWSSTSS